MDWNLTTFHFKIKTWIQVNWEKCGSGGALFCIGSVFFFFSIFSPGKQEQEKKACEVMRSHSHAHNGWQRKNWEKRCLPLGGHCAFCGTSIHTLQTTGKMCGHVWEEVCGERGSETSWLTRSIKRKSSVSKAFLLLTSLLSSHPFDL